MENNIGIPKIPKLSKNINKVDPPKRKTKKVTNINEFEHSWQLGYHLLAMGILHLPKILLTVIVPLAIMTAINIGLESIPTYSLYGATKVIVLFLVFLTSSYNSIIPRTIFWIIIFTIGRSLFIRIKNEGFNKVIGDFKKFPVHFKESKKVLDKLSNYLMIAGTGFGFIAANFLARNNRIDKVFVCFVVAMALVNALSKGKEGMLFVSVKLLYKDLVGYIKKLPKLTNDHTFIIASGFIVGLIGNTIFAVIKLSYGGYILGAALAIIGIVLAVIGKKDLKEVK